ncbi:hypothetical protein GCK72_008980 [Caenorhabditis remanei]|uniref:Uncharacterized protein n=1 Tax=Caenorhabditis remanei TaxID=31234 RepID=A0A6A5H147_CAERE|nr:hypothetical protein GCK72_008980 [Caenorhabditis remanei]KAF1760731.1 hypothetical protein GCK72_008980 [Caenorhabditis remanei]
MINQLDEMRRSQQVQSEEHIGFVWEHCSFHMDGFTFQSKRIIELVEHLVDGVAVSLVADGFVVALSARTATTSTSDDWRGDGQKAEDEESQNIHSE